MFVDAKIKKEPGHLMTIYEALRLFHRPKRWVTGEMTPQERKLVEQDLELYKEAKHVVCSYETYQTLTPDEGHEIALLALDLYDARINSDDYVPQQVLTNLAESVPGALHGLHSRLLDRGISFASNVIFREADPATRDRIISYLAQDQFPPFEGDARADLLCALAWIGDEHVQHQFIKWRQVPPKWSGDFPGPLDLYTYEAGWELTIEGTRRNLYFAENYDLLQIDQVLSTVYTEPIAVITSHEGRCEWCGRALLTLFDMNLRDARMQFVWPGGERLRIAFCLNCSTQAKSVFTEVDAYGVSRWSSLNGEPPEYLDELGLDPTSLPYDRIKLGQMRRTAYVSQGSHVGGCPEWVQDAAFPQCPGCGQTMLLVGQYEPVQVRYLEGIFYAFLCSTCGIATTGYQQT